MHRQEALLASVSKYSTDGCDNEVMPPPPHIPHTDCGDPQVKEIISMASAREPERAGVGLNALSNGIIGGIVCGNAMAQMAYGAEPHIFGSDTAASIPNEAKTSSMKRVT